MPQPFTEEELAELQSALEEGGRSLYWFISHFAGGSYKIFKKGGPIYRERVKAWLAAPIWEHETQLTDRELERQIKTLAFVPHRNICLQEYYCGHIALAEQMRRVDYEEAQALRQEHRARLFKEVG